MASIADLDGGLTGYEDTLSLAVETDDIVIYISTGSIDTLSGSMSGTFTLLDTIAGGTAFEVWGVVSAGTGADVITPNFVLPGNHWHYAWALRGADPVLPSAADVNGAFTSVGFGGIGTTQHWDTVDNSSEYPAMLFGAYARRIGGITMNASDDAPTHELIVASAADYKEWVSAWVPGETPEPVFDVNATTTGNSATLAIFNVWFSVGALPDPEPLTPDGPRIEIRTRRVSLKELPFALNSQMMD